MGVSIRSQERRLMWVDKQRLTQFGRAMMRELGIDMIPACSPLAEGLPQVA